MHRDNLESTWQRHRPAALSSLRLGMYMRIQSAERSKHLQAVKSAPKWNVTIYPTLSLLIRVLQNAFGFQPSPCFFECPCLYAVTKSVSNRINGTVPVWPTWYQACSSIPPRQIASFQRSHKTKHSPSLRSRTSLQASRPRASRQVDHSDLRERGRRHFARRWM